MKKSIFSLLLAIITFNCVFAGDQIKVLSIYSNGKCASVPLAGVDSLKHSKLDRDGILHLENVSSVIHAIDQDYRMPIESIDSIVIGEIDVMDFNAQIKEISDFINSQTELELNQFQTILLSWLNAKENIQEATINEDKDFITICFNNGLEFYIDFQDMSFFETSDTSKDFIMPPLKDSENLELFPFYDVSFQKDETIIKNQVLYVQGHDFSDEVSEPKDKEEFSRLNNELASSPLNLKLKTFTRSLLFLDESFSDYGVIILAQTHGNSKGYFMVDDISATQDPYFRELYWRNMCANRRALQIFTIYNNKNERLIYAIKAKPVFMISPSLIARKLIDSDAIVYGSYCHSFKLAESIRNNTVYGYIPRSSYEENTNYLVCYMYNLLLGRTHKEVMKNVYEELGNYSFIAIQDWSWVHGSPCTNNNESKQRFFSITTDEITQTGTNGQPIISGKINGYENLKKDSLTYLVYCHLGEGKFSPDVAKDDECFVLKIPGSDNSSVNIEEDGSFSFEFPGYLLSNAKYQMIFAFEYNDNYYYGETKYIIPEESDSTITSGELVDLGLSVKWASCNVGATTPTQLGTKVNINIINEAFKNNRALFNEDGSKGNFCGSEYDLAYQQSSGLMRMPTYEELMELKEKCTWEPLVIDGIAGARVVGPNKNSFFLPAETEKLEVPYFGESYTLNYTVYTSGTYDKNLGWGLKAMSISGMYMPNLSESSFISTEFVDDFEALIRPVSE